MPPFFLLAVQATLRGTNHHTAVSWRSSSPPCSTLSSSLNASRRSVVDTVGRLRGQLSRHPVTQLRNVLESVAARANDIRTISRHRCRPLRRLLLLRHVVLLSRLINRSSARVLLRTSTASRQQDSYADRRGDQTILEQNLCSDFHGNSPVVPRFFVFAAWPQTRRGCGWRGKTARPSRFHSLKSCENALLCTYVADTSAMP